MTRRSLPLLTALCLLLAAPVWAGVLYDNGPINGDISAWIFITPYVVSDGFTLSSNSTINGFNFGVWEFPGDTLSSVGWSVTSAENGGTVYASGTVSGNNLSQMLLYTNSLGYEIYDVTATGLNPGLNGGSYWLNLQNAKVPSGDPIYWDENSGVGCGGDDGKGGGCPSQASEFDIGTIASESFTINGTSNSGTTPEPASFLLFASGVLGLAGILRRKLL